MIVGTKARFAIEAEVAERIETWILGHIRFWLCGEPVGNWADSTDLLGCLRWLSDFSQLEVDRYEPGLFDLSPDQVFRLVYDSVMPGGAQHAPSVRDAYRRFHISHLGMSSFERFDMLLLKDENGAERCLWRAQGSTTIRDCRLWRREMESVARDFCSRHEDAIKAAVAPSSR